jgi:CheY-like chemotaxis protein
MAAVSDPKHLRSASSRYARKAQTQPTCIERTVFTALRVLLGRRRYADTSVAVPLSRLPARIRAMARHVRGRICTMMGTATTTSTVTNWHDPRHLCYTRSRRPRVLIVEDDPDLCELMAQLLTGAGFDTNSARNGQDALKQALANPPRVIVLDMMMPVMDGWTFRAHQRYCVTLANIPVVILSAVPVGRLLNVGAAAALQKPFRAAALIATVRAYC